MVQAGLRPDAEPQAPGAAGTSALRGRSHADRRRAPASAPVWRCRALPRPCGWVLDGCLAPFGAVLGPRCLAFSFPLTLLAASRVAGLLGSRRRCRPRLPRICLKRVIQQVLDGACSCWRVARERRPDTTHTFLGCSPSPTSSFLTFSGAARGSGRTPMVLSCRASPKYPGCVIEAQADGRGSPGVSRRLPLEAANCP